MNNPTELPGLEVKELATPEDFADSMAGDLTLSPTETDAFTAKLKRAGFATIPSARSTNKQETGGVL